MSTVLMTVIDLETTGLEPPASVIEIGWTHLEFDTETKASKIGEPNAYLFRPADEMTPENIAVHHLTPAMLAPHNLCTSAELRSVATSREPMFLVAANCAFERQWFTEEVVNPKQHWICTVKAAARLYPDVSSHSNQAMRYQLGFFDLPEALAMPPHRAGPDSYVTAHILAAFLKTTPVRDLVQWTKEPKHLARIPFGKHRGLTWAEAPEDYLLWMLKQADMDADALHAARLEMDKRRPAA